MAQSLPPARRGAAMALGAAVLFGLSTPLTKLLIGSTNIFLLAGLLYLGAGLGLGCWQLLRTGAGRDAKTGRDRIDRAELGWLAAAVVVGGIVAPVLLLLGLRHTDASAAALLLNLEGLFSAVLAALAFGEFLGRRIVLGMAAIAAGALLLAWTGSVSLAFSGGALAIAGACLGWALDNNLTRQVATLDALQIVTVKGCVAGAVNLAIGLVLGATWPAAGVVVGVGVIGLFGYGVSLLLFVWALREIGTARTSAYFSAAPFIGAGVAVVLFGDPLTWKLAVATSLMGFGVWLHLSERHSHEHQHEPMTHTHRHWHDEHHQHAHGPGDPPGEPHRHQHVHLPLRHAHPHYPDLHHRHGH